MKIQLLNAMNLSSERSGRGRRTGGRRTGSQRSDGRRDWVWRTQSGSPSLGATAFATLCWAGLALGGCSEEGGDTPSPDSFAELDELDDRGPHPVGFRVATWEADHRDEALEIKLWYPADAAEDPPIEYSIEFKFSDFQDFSQNVVEGHATRNATVDAESGPYPVIVFSHGFALSPEIYASLVEHWASHGFVVLAPEHTESDWLEAAQTLSTRPLDLSATLDLAESTELPAKLSENMDLEKVAVVGHSFGGYSTLAVSGARLDLPSLQGFCARLDDEDPRLFICAPFLQNPSDIAEQAGIEADLDQLGPSMKDARFRAAVAISGDAYPFGERGLSSIGIPLLALGGTDDFGTPWELGAQMAFEHAGSSERALIGFEGGGHMLPVNDCATMPWTDELGPEYYGLFCEDAVWEKSRGLSRMAGFSTAFVLGKLFDWDEAEDDLLAQGQGEEGIFIQVETR